MVVVLLKHPIVPMDINYITAGGWGTTGGYNSYIIALLLRAAPFSFICGLHILMFMKGTG